MFRSDTLDACSFYPYFWGGRDTGCIGSEDIHARTVFKFLLFGLSALPVLLEVEENDPPAPPADLV